MKEVQKEEAKVRELKRGRRKLMIRAKEIKKNEKGTNEGGSKENSEVTSK